MADFMIFDAFDKLVPRLSIFRAIVVSPYPWVPEVFLAEMAAEGWPTPETAQEKPLAPRVVSPKSTSWRRQNTLRQNTVLSRGGRRKLFNSSLMNKLIRIEWVSGRAPSDCPLEERTVGACEIIETFFPLSPWTWIQVYCSNTLGNI